MLILFMFLFFVILMIAIWKVNFVAHYKFEFFERERGEGGRK